MLNIVFTIIKALVARVIFSYLMKIGFVLLVVISLGSGAYYLFG